MTVSAPDSDGGAIGELVRRLRSTTAAKSLETWTTETLGEFMWSKQIEIGRAVVEHSHVAVKAAHGPGKSHMASRLAAWWLETHPVGSAMVVTTAPSTAQVGAILWRYIRQAHYRGGLGGYITGSNEWKTDYGELIGFGRKPPDHEIENTFQGIHAQYLLIILDEACGLPREMWDAAESLATGADNRILAIGNPDNPRSPFRDCFRPDSGWHQISISAFDTPAFTGEQVPDDVLAQLTSPAWVEARRKYWGEDSPLWASKVLAEFPDIDSDPNILVPLYLSIEATRRDAPDGLPMDWGYVALTERFGRPVFGLDVARFGDDHCVLFGRWGPAAKVIWRSSDRIETTELAGRVTRFARDLAPTMVYVDETGVGGGVVDMLRANGVPVHGVNGGGRPRHRDEFVDLRAELYWSVRKRFIPEGDKDAEMILEPPRDDNGVDELLGDLTEVKWGVTQKGLIVMQSKRGAERDVDVFGSKRPMTDSPDYLDALALTEMQTSGARIVGVGGATKSRS